MKSKENNNKDKINNPEKPKSNTIITDKFTVEVGIDEISINVTLPPWKDRYPSLTLSRILRNIEKIDGDLGNSHKLIVIKETFGKRQIRAVIKNGLEDYLLEGINYRIWYATNTSHDYLEIMGIEEA